LTNTAQYGRSASESQKAKGKSMKPYIPKKNHGLPLCIRKKRQLAMNNENLEKIYIIEIKTVSSFLVASQRKKAGGGNEGKSHYVIENTCRKNGRNWACHYIIEK